MKTALTTGESARGATPQPIRVLTSTLLIAALLCLSTGCASIVTGTHRKVAFKSNPEGAKVTVVNANGKTVAEGTTPFTVKLVKGKPYFRGQTYTLTFVKEGYWDTEQKLKSTVNGWYLGNLVFGGLVGLLVVDPLTGAMYTLPKEVSASLNPRTAASIDEPELRVIHLTDVPLDLRAQLRPVH
jgi:hypothetical protein